MVRQLKNSKLTKRKALFLGVVLFAWIGLSNAQSNGLNVFQDQDQDGLTDQEELSFGTDPKNPDTDNDGYSDGKEIESGYNPLKPAPGDRVIPQQQKQQPAEEEKNKDDGVNLTEKFIEKIQSEKGAEIELLQQISANPQSLQDKTTVESLSDVSLTQDELSSMLEESLSETNIKDELVMLDESEIKVLEKPEGKDEAEIKEKEKQQIEEYFVGVGYIFLQNAPFEVENENELKTKSVSFINEFSSVIQEGDSSKILQVKEKGEQSYDQLKALEVPYVLKDIHLTGLSILNYLLEQDTDALTDQEDPLSMVMMIGKLQSAVGELQSLGVETEKILEEYGIDSFSSSETVKAKVESGQSTEDTDETGTTDIDTGPVADPEE